MLNSLETTRAIIKRSVARTWLNLGDDTVGAAGPLDGSLIRFYTDPSDPTPDSAIGDFTLANLAGSSTVALTYTEPANLSGGKVAKKTQIEEIAGSGQTSEDIKGALIVNAAADDWIACFPFNQAVNVAQEGDGISLDALLTMNVDVNL